MSPTEAVLRHLVFTGALWEPLVGYSRAVRVGAFVAVAGTTAALVDGEPVGGADACAQTRSAISCIAEALEQVGARLDDVIRRRMFVTDITRWEEIGRAHGEAFATIRPAASMIDVRALIDPRPLIEVEADAIIGNQDGERTR